MKDLEAQQRYLDPHHDLIERCKQNDRKAQYELYKRYAKNMLNVSFRIVNDIAEAEDILQESFLSAFGNLHNYRSESSFGIWLKKIVVNNSINRIRKRKINTVSLEAQFGGDDPDVPDTREDYGELVLQVESIKKAISKLPDGYRIVFSLYLLEGYDHSEIAEILGVTESTSKSQFNRAKKKLLEIMKRDSNHN